MVLIEDDELEDEGCGTCDCNVCQCDTMYDNYRDSLLERE